ncbi:MAG: dNTP triphosphohydrolase [Phycisphaerales bacterium]|nr:MAG: dNTP triphosphohydrolase [Phycisphaerales bacterium]
MPALASCAVADSRTRGRVHNEPCTAIRTPFEVDRHRVITCTAFRRVRSKTQVVGESDDDHVRTRMTHSLEVADVARVLAGRLGANAALAEVIALAHDLGHPPFGHAGEAALDELAAGHGGFEHNAQSLRVVDYLEHPFPQFRGLNLTYEVREGLIKHVTRFDHPCQPYDTSGAELLHSGPMPTVEAQIVALADRFAYDLHDLEDAIGAGFLDLDACTSVRLWREVVELLAEDLPPGWSIHAVRRPIINAMLSVLIQDVAAASAGVLARFASVDEVRRQPSSVVVLSPGMTDRLEELEACVAQRYYRRPEVAAADAQGKRIIRELFETYLADPSLLPPRFVRRLADQGAHRVICDYVAGMTDRFCRAAHGRVTRTR